MKYLMRYFRSNFWSKGKSPWWHHWHIFIISLQECIPVGLLPGCCPYLPACTASRGYLPRGCTCPGDVYLAGEWGVYLPVEGGVPAWGYLPRYSPLWTEWQTGAKILPCPKLRLRAVINRDGVLSFVMSSDWILSKCSIFWHITSKKITATTALHKIIWLPCCNWNNSCARIRRNRKIMMWYFVQVFFHISFPSLPPQKNS